MDTEAPSLGTTKQEGGLRAPKPDRDIRLAAGMGKLQEVDLGPEAFERNMAKIEEARKRGEGYTPDTRAKAGDSKDQQKPGKRRRWQKRRNSEDLRRDMAVEAVLKEAKRTSALLPFLYIPVHSPTHCSYGYRQR